MNSLPAYYSSLKGFRTVFETGRPTLMYHKIAKRPKNARIKGLYVDPDLFEKQLEELRDEGFTTPAYAVPESVGNKEKTIALSFDDGFASAFHNALEPLAKYRFKAIQFLVADRIGQFNAWEVQLGDLKEPLMDAAQIKDWIAAGHQIGAHSLTHPYLTRVSFREAREEVISSRKKLEDKFGVAVIHFCYPYGDWNEPIRDLVREAGYQTACTTETGVNTSTTSPWELKRIMARHRSISIKSIRASLTR